MIKDSSFGKVYLPICDKLSAHVSATPLIADFPKGQES